MKIESNNITVLFEEKREKKKLGAMSLHSFEVLNSYFR